MGSALSNPGSGHGGARHPAPPPLRPPTSRQLQTPESWTSFYISFFSNLYSYPHPEIKTAEAQFGPKPGKEPRVKNVLTASISSSVKRELHEVFSKSPDGSVDVGPARVQVGTHIPVLSPELPK